MKKGFLLFCLLGAYVYVSAAFVPKPGFYYNIVHTSSTLVLGSALSGGTQTTQPAIMSATNDAFQAFQFIPVAGKTDTYYIQNYKGAYFNTVSYDTYDVKFQPAINSTYSEWVISGTDSTSIQLCNNYLFTTLNNGKGYIGVNSNTSGSSIYSDKYSGTTLSLTKATVSSTAFSVFIPKSGFYYNIVSKSSSLVLGPSTSGGTQPAIMTVANDGFQAFQFISVAGKDNTYYIQNYQGSYFNKSASNTYDTKFEGSTNGIYSEWVILGTDSTNLRLANNYASSLSSNRYDIGTNANTSGQSFYTDKYATYYSLTKATYGTTTSIVNVYNKNLFTQKTNLGIDVYGVTKNACVNTYNMMGTKIASTIAKTNIVNIPVSVSGAFVVEVISNGQKSTLKVIR